MTLSVWMFSLKRSLSLTNLRRSILTGPVPPHRRGKEGLHVAKRLGADKDRRNQLNSTKLGSQIQKIQVLSKVSSGILRGQLKNVLSHIGTGGGFHLKKKKDMWAIVKTKYDVPEDNKPYVIADLGKKWREWKSTLRTKYFLQNEPPPPGSVIPSEYQILCDFWNSTEGQKLCATNKANRAQQTIAHTAGSRSYARVTKMEFKAKKKMPSRADTFVITHTKKDGEAADPKSKEIMAKIKERQEQNPKPESSRIPSRDDLFGQLMGEETRGRVRMLGFFATPSTTLGTATRPPQPRGNSFHLNTKMAQLEQVNAIMAEELTQVKQQMSQILTYLQDTPEDV
ncbi:uncharacterized protein LOC143891073 [Tasmannia lanceolata]|uniref:uncharacterized protein LOC143891073 n=1 Tax=Tasmannia lanceolata TaxID=3420 RepID=UPI0040628988